MGVKVPTVIDFADILQLNAVKHLQAKNKEVFDFMSLFTSTDSKQFESKVKNFQKLMEEEKLEVEDVIRKKQYVQICSLKLEDSNHKYDDLAGILNVSLHTLVSSGHIDQERRCGTVGYRGHSCWDH